MKKKYTKLEIEISFVSSEDIMDASDVFIDADLFDTALFDEQ